jgi:hypothetical protein
MIPGPDRIIACPRCKGLARCGSTSSGNTFGARIWSDGKPDAPMLPRLPSIAKCRHCGKYYWIDRAKQVGIHDWYEDEFDPYLRKHPRWPDVEPIVEPDESECCEALAKRLARSKARRRELRLLAWWKRNDAFRESDGEAREMEARCKENLEALVDLLDESDATDRLMKAEVLRELGEFEAAKVLLQGVDDPELAPFARQLRALCDARDTRVRELESGS